MVPQDQPLSWPKRIDPDLLDFPCWSIFCRGPTRLSSSLWALWVGSISTLLNGSLERPEASQTCPTKKLGPKRKPKGDVDVPRPLVPHLAIHRPRCQAVPHSDSYRRVATTRLSPVGCMGSIHRVRGSLGRVMLAEGGVADADEAGSAEVCGGGGLLGASEEKSHGTGSGRARFVVAIGVLLPECMDFKLFLGQIFWWRQKCMDFFWPIHSGSEGWLKHDLFRPKNVDFPRCFMGTCWEPCWSLWASYSCEGKLLSTLEVWLWEVGAGWHLL